MLIDMRRVKQCQSWRLQSQLFCSPTRFMGTGYRRSLYPTEDVHSQFYVPYCHTTVVAMLTSAIVISSCLAIAIAPSLAAPSMQ